MTAMTRRAFLGALPALTAGLAAAAEPFETIDGHVHVWTQDPRYPWAKETVHPPKEDASAEQLLRLMAANGVSRTVIIQVIHYRWDNRYAADTLKRYPDRFRGVARVNPEDPAAPDTLSLLTERDGFRGVRISPSAEASGDWIRGPLMAPLWRRCGDLKVPMTVLIPATRVPDVMRWIDRYPDVTVVVDHMADCPLDRPDLLRPLLALSRYPKVYVKVSHAWSLSKQRYPYLDSQEQIHRIYDAFGPRRLIAGTDWPIVLPFCTYRQAIDLLRSHVGFLTDEDRRWICGKTAASVWWPA